MYQLKKGGVCDKILSGEVVTTGTKCRLHQFRQEIFNHEPSSKPNILKIIEKFEEISRKSEKTNPNGIEGNFSTQIKGNLSMQIKENHSTQFSGGDSKELLKKNVFKFGADGQKGGGGSTVIKAKPSSARKQPKKLKSHANYKSITDYFKPSVEREINTGSGGKETKSGGKNDS